MSPRATCVTSDPALRKVLRRSLCAVGTDVSFVQECQEVLSLEGGPGALVVVDDAANREGVRELLEGVGGETKVVLLGAPEAALDLLRSEGCDHLLGQGPGVDEGELVVTSVKLFGGNIFGLEKYLTWGVQIRQREVASYDEKRAAMREVSEFARAVGCRRQLVARIETVVDELLMNALYDAPAMRYGSRPRFQKRGRPGAGPVTDQHAVLRYGSDGKHFAVAVRDNFGELRKANILDHLERAREEQGLPRVDAEEGGGGGLGLYFILNSVTRFIANIAPGEATEVICLFDMRTGARDYHYRAKSLSIFTGAAEENAPA